MVDRVLARRVGLNEAIVIQQVHYWLKINELKKQNFKDGRYWTYNSLRDWHETDFDFWSFGVVQRTFAKLVDLGILITANYNKDKRDRTKWYSIDYEKLEKLTEQKKKKHGAPPKPQSRAATVNNAYSQNANLQNAKLQNEKMHVPEITKTCCCCHGGVPEIPSKQGGENTEVADLDSKRKIINQAFGQAVEHTSAFDAVLANRSINDVRAAVQAAKEYADNHDVRNLPGLVIAFLTGDGDKPWTLRPQPRPQPRRKPRKTAQTGNSSFDISSVEKEIALIESLY